jgi:solute carrier family 25 carnitine/acylcarnitine transporter 20/29
VKENLIRRNLAQDKTLGGVAFCGAIGGISSGMLLSVGTTAFEFAKVKQQLEYLISTQRGLPYKPTGTLRGFAELYRKGGIRMLYTGFYLHAARDTIVSCILDSGLRYWH